MINANFTASISSSLQGETPGQSLEVVNGVCDVIVINFRVALNHIL